MLIPSYLTTVRLHSFQGLNADCKNIPMENSLCVQCECSLKSVFQGVNYCTSSSINPYCHFCNKIEKQCNERNAISRLKIVFQLLTFLQFNNIYKSIIFHTFTLCYIIRETTHCCSGGDHYTCENITVIFVYACICYLFEFGRRRNKSINNLYFSISQQQEILK